MLRFADATDIDCSQPLRFTFDGRKCVGYQGDTLASALLGCGVVRTNSTARLGRARGIFAATPFYDHSLIQLVDNNRDAVISPTAVALYDGLEAHSVHGSQRFSLWHKVIGRKANTTPPLTTENALLNQLNLSDSDASSSLSEKVRLHTDVLVIGGGLAGAQVAAQLAAQKVRVLVVDRNANMRRRTFAGDHAECAHYAAQARTAWRHGLQDGSIQALHNTQVLGCTDDGLFIAISTAPNAVLPNEGAFKVFLISASAVVVAHGARELMLPFAGNDLPGVMSAQAVQSYAQRYGVAPGTGTLVVCNNDLAYETAFTLRAMGGVVRGVVDSRRNPGAVMQAALGSGIDVYQGSVVRVAEGGDRVESVELVPFDAPPDERQRQRRVIACDALAVSGGFMPYTDLFTQPPAVPVVYAGAAAGCGADTEDVLLSAYQATAKVMQHLNYAYTPPQLPAMPRSVIRTAAPDEAALQPIMPDNTFVAAYAELTYRDLCQAEHDLTQPPATLLPSEAPFYWYFTQHAARESQRQALSIENFETTMAAQRPTARIGKAIGAIAIGAQRLSPLHDVHLELKAYLLHGGAFLRPAYYRRGLQSKAGVSVPLLPDVQHEYDALSREGGLCDTSSDGVLRIQGVEATTLAQLLTNVEAPHVGDMLKASITDDLGVLLAYVQVVRLSNHVVAMLPLCGTLTAISKRAEHLKLMNRLGRVAIRDRREAEARLTLGGARALDMRNALLGLTANDFPPAIMSVEIGGLMTDIVADSAAQTVDFCIPAGQASTLWRAITAQGATPIGEQAREVLRVERAQMGNNELRRRLSPKNTTLMMLHGIENLPKGRHADNLHAHAPDHLTIEGNSNTRAQITSWCYAPARGQFVGLAMTETPEPFFQRDAIMAQSAHWNEGLQVRCFPLPETA